MKQNNELTKTDIRVLKTKLQRQLEYTFPLKEQKNLLVGIADYVKIVEDSECLSKIIKDDFQKKQKEILQKMEAPFDSAYDECVKIFNEIEPLIGKEKILDDELAKAITDYKDCSVGKCLYEGTINLTMGFMESLKKVIITLNKVGYTEIAKNYADFDKAGNLVNWKLSQTEQKLNEMLFQYKKLRDVSIWGDWEKMYWVYLVFYFEEDDDTAFRYMKAQMKCGVLMGEMSPPAMKDKLQVLPDYEKNLYKISLHKIHTRLITELDVLTLQVENENSKIPNFETKSRETNLELRKTEKWYIPETGTGFIRGKKFSLTEGKDKFNVFNELIKNKKVKKERVKELLNLQDTLDSTVTYTINNLVTELRKTTKLTKTELLNNGGNLSLATPIKIKSLNIT